MRRLVTPASAVAALFMVGSVVGATASHADPCGTRGTLSDRPTTITIGQGDAEPNRTFYVRDRNANYLSEIPEDDPQGIWIYAESNGWAGLQSGGDGYVLSQLPVHDLPPLGPIPVIPPDPNRPVLQNGITLFPGPGPVFPIGHYDACHQYGWPNGPPSPDTLIF